MKEKEKQEKLFDYVKDNYLLKNGYEKKSEHYMKTYSFDAGRDKARLISIIHPLYRFRIWSIKFIVICGNDELDYNFEIEVYPFSSPNVYTRIKESLEVFRQGINRSMIPSVVNSKIMETLDYRKEHLIEKMGEFIVNTLE